MSNSSTVSEDLSMKETALVGQEELEDGERPF